MPSTDSDQVAQESHGDASQPSPLSARFVRDPGCIVALARELANADDDAAPRRADVVAVQRAIGRLAGVDPLRLLGELDAALGAPNAGAIVQALEDLGALVLLLPEVHAFIGFHRSSPLQHKDLWSHTLTVLERTAPETDLRWVALCHDIGKVATRAIGEDGRIAFHRHEAVGARLFLGIGARLAMPAERIARIAFVIEHHARTNQFEPSWSDRALRRLIRDSGERLPLMLAFSAADWTTKKAARAERIQKHLDILRQRLDALVVAAAAPPGVPLLPAGLGDALLEVSAAASGPWVGQAVRWAENEARAGHLTGLDARAVALRWSAAHPASPTATALALPDNGDSVALG